MPDAVALNVYSIEGLEDKAPLHMPAHKQGQCDSWPVWGHVSTGDKNKGIMDRAGDRNCEGKIPNICRSGMYAGLWS